MWRNDALYLSKEGMSWRGIAKKLQIPKSTVSDFYAQTKFYE